MNQPLFVILNGGEAVGKGTQKQKLVDLYPDAIQVREPGGTPEAEIIRLALLEKDDTLDERIEKINQVLAVEHLEPITRDYLLKAKAEMQKNGLNGNAEAYLYAASRAESNQKVVKTALENHQIVLGDRSVACSMAYQGYARGVGMDFVWELNQPTLENAMPQLEIFLNLPLEETQKRLAGRVEKQDRLDLESKDFHQKVRQGYLDYYENYCPYPYVILDASGTVEEVHEKIKETIENFQTKACQ